MSDNEKVREFHGKFGLNAPGLPTLDLNAVAARLEHIEEETRELTDAAAARDLVGVADALVDIAYLVHGMAVNLGLPWQELFADVHRANLAKVRTDAPDHKFGITKPAGWEGPRTAEILRRHGYHGEL